MVASFANIGKGATGTKAITSAMGREALEGVATDMIMAASGGGLSNLIKENAPDWYPTWPTALAIDEDDNPFEAAFKTALEGGLLGANIGAVGAYLKVPVLPVRPSREACSRVIQQRALELLKLGCSMALPKPVRSSLKTV